MTDDIMHSPLPGIVSVLADVGIVKSGEWETIRAETVFCWFKYGDIDVAVHATVNMSEIYAYASSAGSAGSAGIWLVFEGRDNWNGVHQQHSLAGTMSQRNRTDPWTLASWTMADAILQGGR